MSTHERIRRAALELFASRGYAATGIRDLAEAANVSTSVLYHYVGTKEELLVDIIRSSQERLQSVAEAALEASKLPEERLAVLVQVHVLAHAHLRLEAVVADTEIRALGPTARKEAVRLRDKYERLWKNTLEHGLRDGVFDVADARFGRLALLEMCTGVAHWYRPGKGTDQALLAAFADSGLGLVRAARNGRSVRASDLELPSCAQIGGWLGL
jgi:AcrR family transcriptional regulator